LLGPAPTTTDYNFNFNSFIENEQGHVLEDDFVNDIIEEYEEEIEETSLASVCTFEIQYILF
jgi:hypothetical protein